MPLLHALILWECREKAGEKLQTARTAFERGDFSEAKMQIDSIKILYPKAFEARREGIGLMQQVELKEQEKHLFTWIACFNKNKENWMPWRVNSRSKKMPNINK